MSTSIRQPKAAGPRKLALGKPGKAAPTKTLSAQARAGTSAQTATPKAIAAAVQHCVTTHFDALMEQTLADNVELQGMLAQIDRSLDAAQALTVRLLAEQA